MQNRRNQEQGITLIALIVTIIVMLILVTVTVRTLINSGLFDHTRNAAQRWQEEEQKEEAVAGGQITIGDKKYNSIDDYLATRNVYVYLYQDGTLTFSSKEQQIENEEDILKAYGNITINSQFEVVPNAEDNVLWQNEREQITKVDFLDEIHPVSTAGWFRHCENLTEINHIENLDTSNVTDMSFMFSTCTSLKSIDLSHFNTSNVTTMQSMFVRCSGLESLDISGFDTSNVENMRSMFNECSSLTSLDLSEFDTRNVTTMYCMFYKCSGLTSLDLSSFDTSNVTDMTYMFSRCSNLNSLNLSHFNTENVTIMQRMFQLCNNLTSLDLSSFDTNNVTDISNMFRDASRLTTIKVGEKWNIKEGANINDMFKGCGTQTVSKDT